MFRLDCCKNGFGSISIFLIIYPFVESLSDKIVEDQAEGASWIDQMMSDPGMEIKGITHICRAMEHYKQNTLRIISSKSFFQSSILELHTVHGMYRNNN